MKSRKTRRTTLVAIGVGVTGILLLIYFGFRQDIDAARNRVATGSEVVNTPCGLVEYAVAGTGPPLLMIHGAGGGFDQSMHTGSALVESGFQLIAVSRFGYLRTPLPNNASPMAQADAHACLLDELDLQEVFVIGGSMGAPSAMQFCIRHADRCNAMVLLVPIGFVPQEKSELAEQPSAFTQWLANVALKSDFVFWLGIKVARETVVETILATPYAELERASSTEQDRVLEMMRYILPISQRSDGLKNDMSTDLPRYELERIGAPSLIISSETDLFGTFKIGRYTAEQIPGARFIGYPTGGHTWIGRHKDIMSEVATFLNGQRRLITHQEK